MQRHLSIGGSLLQPGCNTKPSKQNPQEGCDCTAALVNRHKRQISLQAPCNPRERSIFRNRVYRSEASERPRHRTFPIGATGLRPGFKHGNIVAYTKPQIHLYYTCGEPQKMTQQTCKVSFAPATCPLVQAQCTSKEISE